MIGHCKKFNKDVLLEAECYFCKERRGYCWCIYWYDTTSTEIDKIVEMNDLLCCGNCLHRNVLDCGDYSQEICKILLEPTGSSEFCDKHEYDGLYRELRIKELKDLYNSISMYEEE